jgi:hypothetical protein
MARTRWPPDPGPRPLAQDGQIGTAPPAVPQNLGPGRRIVSRTAREGISRFGGQAGTQASDPTPAPGQNPASRPRSEDYLHPPCRFGAGGLSAG